jgi:NAD(P)-dependent dehydrogenase (short-subunit alcohol dehydrogenase family)
MALRNLYPSLAGKVVLITGGATGIGASLVEAFSRQRAVVAFVDILENDARELVARLENDAAATPPHFFACDLRDIDALKSVIAEVRSTLGPVAVLVNNAANDARHDFRELTPDAWNDRINVNMRHPERTTACRSIPIWARTSTGSSSSGTPGRSGRARFPPPGRGAQALRRRVAGSSTTSRSSWTGWIRRWRAWSRAT